MWKYITDLFEVPINLDLPVEKHTDFAVVVATGAIGTVTHVSFLCLF